MLSWRILINKTYFQRLLKHGFWPKKVVKFPIVHRRDVAHSRASCSECWCDWSFREESVPCMSHKTWSKTIFTRSVRGWSRAAQTGDWHGTVGSATTCRRDSDRAAGTMSSPLLDTVERLVCPGKPATEKRTVFRFVFAIGGHLIILYMHPSEVTLRAR